MAFVGDTRQQMNYRSENGTQALRNFVESTIVSEIPDIDRIVRYQLYWHFYRGRHWRMYNETLLSFNYVKAIIDKQNSFLVGRSGLTFKVESYSNSEIQDKEQTTVEALLDYHWKHSKKNTLIYNMLQMGAVTGDLWVIVTSSAIDATEEKFLKLNVADSRHCFPGFEQGNTNVMEKFELRQPLIKNNNGYKVFCTMYTADKIETWYQKDTAVKGKKFEPESVKNPFEEIPVFHIKNKITSDDYFSISDCADILKINKIYNEIGQELKSIIDYYGTPTTVITGATVPQLQKGLGMIWSGLPPEANVFNLGLGEDLSSSIEFMKMLKASMHELTDVPENALGKLQAISNTSAAALAITYQPLIQQADLKWLVYGEGIVEINTFLLRMSKKFKYTKLSDPIDEAKIKDYFCSPVFKYGLPIDRMNELQVGQMELQMKITTRNILMNKLGMTNVPKIITAIDEEQLHLGEIQAEIMAKTNAAQMPPDQNQPPNPAEQQK